MRLRKYFGVALNILMLDQIVEFLKCVHVRTTVKMEATEHFLLHENQCFIFNVLTLTILSDTQLTAPISSVLSQLI